MNVLLFQTAQIFTKANWEKVLKSVATWCLGFGKNLLIAIIVLVVGNKMSFEIYRKSQREIKIGTNCNEIPFITY